MKIAADQKELKGVLTSILAVVPESKLALSAVMKIQTEGPDVYAYYGNNSVYLREKLPGVVIEPGSCGLYGRYLGELVKKLGDSPVELVFDTNRLVVKQKGLRYKIPTVTLDNFWSFHELHPDVYSPLNPKALVACIDAVSYAVSSTSMEMSQILVEPGADGQIRAVGTDGIRLSLRSDIGVLNTRFLLSPEMAKSLKKYLVSKTEMSIFTEPALLHVETPEGYLKLRAVGVNFVNYRAILPQSPFATIAFNKEELLASLLRMQLLDSKLVRTPMMITIRGSELTITMQNEDGEGEERVTVESDISEERQILVNPNLLIDALEHMDEATLRIRHHGNGAPLILTNDSGALALISQRRR